MPIPAVLWRAVFQATKVVCSHIAQAGHKLLQSVCQQGSSSRPSTGYAALPASHACCCPLLSSRYQAQCWLQTNKQSCLTSESRLVPAGSVQTRGRPLPGRMAPSSSHGLCYSLRRRNKGRTHLAALRRFHSTAFWYISEASWAVAGRVLRCTLHCSSSSPGSGTWRRGASLDSPAGASRCSFDLTACKAQDGECSLLLQPAKELSARSLCVRTWSCHDDRCLARPFWHSLLQRHVACLPLHSRRAPSGHSICWGSREGSSRPWGLSLPA